jgi:hypothetical protein
MPRRKPSPATVISLVALFVALGGTSYAAITVTGANVRNSSLTGADIRNSSLTGTDVRDGSLLARDFRGGELPSGAQGPAGPAGAQGAPGATGARGADGPQGPRGETGAQGAQGVQGVAGEPGSAVAYAHVNPTGGIDETRSKGLVDANVTQGSSAGSYCFKNLPFTPKTMVASADLNPFATGSNDAIVTVDVTAANTSHNNCGQGVPVARLFDISDGSLRDGSFYVVFDD